MSVDENYQVGEGKSAPVNTTNSLEDLEESIMATSKEEQDSSPEIIVEPVDGDKYTLKQQDLHHKDGGLRKSTSFRALVRKGFTKSDESPGLLSVPKAQLPTAKRSKKNNSRGLVNFLFGIKDTQKVHSLYAEEEEDIEDNSVPVSYSLWHAVRENDSRSVTDLLANSPDLVDEVDNLGNSPLHLAAKHNAVAVMSVLIRHNADVNKEGPYRYCPLHTAARHNNCEAAQVLIQSRANLMCQDAKMKTPLHLAARHGHLQMARTLLTGVGGHVAVNAVDEDELTPLFDAVMHRQTKMAILLIEKGANIYAEDINETLAFHFASAEELIDLLELFMATGENLYGLAGKDRLITHRDNEGNTALHMAILNNKLKASEYLLRKGASVNSRNGSHSAPLHMAAVNGNVPITELLLSYKAIIDRRDKEHMTAIHRAAMFNRYQIIEILLNKGGDVNVKSEDQMSPLMMSCWKGHVQTTNFLLKNGAQIDQADQTCRTALHLAVQNSHPEVITQLLQHGCSSVMECLDQTDQTALHYAAKLGDMNILCALLKHKSRLDARDQDGKTPLHVAAEYSNAKVIDILMQASQTELNDPDSDGKTPIMVAAEMGNYNTAQALLYHGADLSMRDEEYRTATMLATGAGHTKLVKLLLNNYAEINISDKVKNTPLHIAAYHGHSDTAKLLLCRNAKVTSRNSYGKTAIDAAIENKHTDVVIEMLKHTSWRDSMEMRDEDGFTPMKRLIEKVPEAALVVMDNCMEYSDHRKDDLQYTAKHDFKFIDPGPSDPCCQQIRYFAVHTMVEKKRDDLLGHPLVQSLLLMKWRNFGRVLFYLNLASYFLFLIILLTYMALVPKITTGILDDVRSCPVIVNATEAEDPILLASLKAEGSYSYRKVTNPVALAFNNILIGITNFYCIREIISILVMRVHYFKNINNYLIITMLVSTLFFLIPSGYLPCEAEWRAGWIAALSSCILFMHNLSGLDSIGIYFVMFTEVMQSLFKVMTVLVLFLMSFASAFAITMAQTPGLTPDSWYPMTVLSMTLGEINFVDNYSSTLNTPYTIDNMFLMGMFMIVMPIGLMNLLVGIAVGDIDKIQKEAYLTRLSLQIQMLCSYEATFPRILQRKLYKRRFELKPNMESLSCWNQFKKRILKVENNDTYLEEDGGDPTTDMLNQIKHDMRKQKAMLLQMQAAQKQQQEMMRQICSHLDVNVSLSRLSPVDSVRSDMLSRMDIT
ncbi:transient receptor potential cation channel subfamily A member 1-like [Ylistrum balloti]|uniref:transient receptor potential cation channel subfamily A member 1-like n=1 Tax=Ylistrum balloti TaxID=509963 RepID=UPI0029057FC7|nr:transient receptor potential cation channel subfamily A member 1-like [Ylistrum balloti]